MLPTKDQMMATSTSLQVARDIVTMVGCAEPEIVEVGFLQTKFVEHLQKIAATLGFELVQRVTPATRDGGRMDVEDADA